MRSRNGTATRTSRPCRRASWSVASLSSGWFSRIWSIFSRRRAFLRLNSFFDSVSDCATLSGVAERSERGRNPELRLRSTPGKSEVKIGATAGGAGPCLRPGLGMALVLDALANYERCRLFRRHLEAGEGEGAAG